MSRIVIRHKNDNNNDQWKAIALSFAAGAVSMSLWMYVRERRVRRIQREITKDDEDQDQADKNKNNNHNPNDNPRIYGRTDSSFLDTVCQSVEDAVEDIKSRIGELPSTTRRHWPWETIHAKRKSDSSSSGTGSGSSSTGSEKPPQPDPTMKLTPERSQPVQSNPELCIGSIFGLDVGGTLAKLVYFEQRPDHDIIGLRNVRERHYHQAASAQAVLKARRGHDYYQEKPALRSTVSSHDKLRKQPSSGGGFSPASGLVRRRLTSSSVALHQQAAEAAAARASSGGDDMSCSTTSDDDNRGGDKHGRTSIRGKAHHAAEIHTSDSDNDLTNLYNMRQDSVPDDLNKYANSVHCLDENVVAPTTTRNKKQQQHQRNIKNNLNTTTYHNHAKPGNPKSFSAATTGKATGATAATGAATAAASGMKKSRSMFDLSISQKSRDHAEALDRFYHFARKLDSYREGVKDHKLSFYSRALGGEFHFIRFETRRMENAMELIRANDLHLTIREMGATGGGAHKFAHDWDRLLGIQMKKQEELDSLVAGMQFVLSTVVGECYTFRPKMSNTNNNTNNSSKTETTACTPPSLLSKVSSSSFFEEEKKTPGGGGGGLSPFSSSSEESDSETTEDIDSQGGTTDEWWWSRKVQRDSISYSSTYPYLLVTIGTGVSILRVDGPRKHERISGSTIGGGTYWGLIRLLTDLEDFEDVMRLAEHGDPSKVDMLVGDIYGNNKEALEKLGLPASLVASSFGKLVAREDPAAGLKQEDLARALLLMVTNNIGQVAYLNAQLHKTSRIYFVGNFLRGNKLSQRRLSFAINYWSKGEMEALFLEHEGYFGALGAFLLSQGISLDDLGPPPVQRNQSQNEKRRSKSSRNPNRRSQTLEEHQVMF